MCCLASCPSHMPALAFFLTHVQFEKAVLTYLTIAYGVLRIVKASIAVGISDGVAVAVAVGTSVWVEVRVLLLIRRGVRHDDWQRKGELVKEVRRSI